jgi:hypothetical protein
MILIDWDYSGEYVGLSIRSLKRVDDSDLFLSTFI